MDVKQDSTPFEGVLKKGLGRVDEALFVIPKLNRMPIVVDQSYRYFRSTLPSFPNIVKYIEIRFSNRTGKAK